MTNTIQVSNQGLGKALKQVRSSPAVLLGLIVVLIEEYAGFGKAVEKAPQARLQDAGDSF